MAHMVPTSRYSGYLRGLVDGASRFSNSQRFKDLEVVPQVSDERHMATTTLNPMLGEPSMLGYELQGYNP